MELVHSVISRFLDSAHASKVTALGNAGGFSGAGIWKVDHRGQSYALRRWPREHPDLARLTFIHIVQKAMVEFGVHAVPRLLLSQSGKTICPQDNSFWEMSTWMTGTPCYHSDPNDEKLASAMVTLAAMHNAAADINRPCRYGVSPGMQMRLDLATKTTPRQLAAIANRIDDSYPDLTTLCNQVVENTIRLANACRKQLEEMGLPSTRLIPCVRDIWHDHILFTNDDVTGVIDFGATQIDSPATDIARLLGSLVGDDRRAWDFALRVYNEMRPLDDRDWAVELAAIRALDIANVTYSGMNWIRWLYVDRRHFADLSGIKRRLTAIAERQRTSIELLRI